MQKNAQHVCIEGRCVSSQILVVQIEDLQTRFYVRTQIEANTRAPTGQLV